MNNGKAAYTHNYFGLESYIVNSSKAINKPIAEKLI